MLFLENSRGGGKGYIGSSQGTKRDTLRPYIANMQLVMIAILIRIFQELKHFDSVLKSQTSWLILFDSVLISQASWLILFEKLYLNLFSVLARCILKIFEGLLANFHS